MKNFKTKGIFFNILIAMFCLCAILLFTAPNQLDNRVISYASCSKYTVPGQEEEKSTKPMYTDKDYGGKIPFSLFLSHPNGTQFDITDYNPTFIQTLPENKEDSYKYEMDPNSTPTILLSSEATDTETRKLYDTTIFFKFNDQEFKNKEDSTIPNESGYLNITATVNDKPIIAEILDTSADGNATTKEAAYIFKLNLRKFTGDQNEDKNVACPRVPNNSSGSDTGTIIGGSGENNQGQSDGSYLGGDGEKNDVSYRTGKYNFNIRYSFRKDQSVSNECVFDLTFYVIDYMDYVKDNSPFNFYNTDTVTYRYYNEKTSTYENKDANYEIYNYNYLESPILEFDATKFGTNFIYTAGFSNYSIRYKNFQYAKLDEDFLLTPTNIENIFKSTSPSNVEITRRIKLGRNGGLSTGIITLELRNHPEVTYTINTYYEPDEENKYYDQKYIAQLNFKDFEKFLTKEENKKIFTSATTMQGTYHFDLDFLAEAGEKGYIPRDKSLFEYIPTKITQQKLVIFGYELKYFDQNPNSKTYRQDVTLVNENTHTNFISYNSLTNGNFKGLNTGFLVNIPKYIAITDQAPLRFHSYGNLYGNSVDYVADYAWYDYLAMSEQEVLDYFKEETETDAEGNPLRTSGIDYVNNLNRKGISYDRRYNQGASISGDGIRIMKLEYRLNLNILSDDGESILEEVPIMGYQYIVFEINNTVQNLYIQSIDTAKNEAYDFDTYTNKNVRINLEQKPNTFYAPVNVDFQFASDYKRDNLSVPTRLSLKGNGSVTEIIDGRKYGYFISNQTQNNGVYTFRLSGYYKLTIRSVVSNVPKTYSFIIDKDPFANIYLNEIQLSEEAVDGKTTYLKTSSVLQDVPIASSSTDYLKNDLYITKDGFTLSWDEKASKANSYSYVYYMEITDDTTYSASSMFDVILNAESETPTEEYWMTNGLKTKSLSSAIDTYKNSVNVIAPSMNTILAHNQYFNKDGLYFFYVYDNAGNYFTRIVLIDSSQSTTLQGYWVKNEEGIDVWNDTFDPVGNPANYVDHDTTIYFGSHKAISMPDTLTNTNISIEDISFTRAYDLKPKEDGSPNGEQKLIKPTIDINFKTQVLDRLTNYIKTTSSDAIISNSKTKVLSKAGTYLTLRNTVVNYQRIPTAVDLETEEVIERPEFVSADNSNKNQISEIYKAEIFTRNDTSKYKFYDEAEYIFKVTNLNTAKTSKYICMNFDKVQGTFFGYGKIGEDNGGERTEHILRRNGATNLKNLKFEYKKISDETAQYYTLKSLTYDYYEFVLDDSYTPANGTYPFAETPTNAKVDILKDQKLSEDGTKWIIDPINIDNTEFTRAGRYVVTRTYVGGTHNKVGEDENGNPICVPTEDGTGGDHYFSTSSNTFIPLFELDIPVRKYIVFVDHYGIITSTYMVRVDGKENVREVGDNITITLSANYNDSRKFTEFFLTSTATLSLDTNKIPVQINIPFTKYFATRNIFSKHNFSKLEITVRFRLSKNSEWLTYVVDGYDTSTGFCTTSDPRVKDSVTNPNGYLIFKSAGEYEININDNTGYLDITSNSENNTNLEPTKYSYRFKISHTPPTSEMYTTTYNTNANKFETNRLYNNDDSNNFATNIKKVNETLESSAENNNKALVSWNDAITPYTARINRIDIAINDPTSPINYNLSINLKNYDLLTLARTNSNLTFTNDDYNKYILHFKVTFFEGISEPTIYDNEPYYRFNYEMSLDITEEYVYNITFHYVTDTENNPYIDANKKNFGKSDYKLSIDRTKPFTNIDNLLKQSSEEFLYSSGYYTSQTISNFKEENFNPFELENLPSIFTYSFGVDNTFTLNYAPEDTLSYFFVRNYDKYDSQYISITPDMVDTVYTADKAYADRLQIDSENNYYGFGPEYPRFKEVGLNHNEINIANYKWYKIDYDNKTSLYSLIARATNNAPSGYYEIIERDLAGNYRAYTVYFSEYGSDNYFLTLNIKGYHQQGYTEVNYSKDSAITATSMFELTELSSKLGWGKLTIKNETSDIPYDEEIFFSPFDSPSSDKIKNRIKKLNDFFKCKYNSTYSLTLSKYNNYFNSITRSVIVVTNESTKLSAPTIEEVYNVTSTTYNLVFPIYTIKSVLFLEYLRLDVLNGPNNWAIYYDKVNNTPAEYNDGKNSIPQKITGLPKGIYRATYKDNYNKKEYTYIVYVGEYYINNFNREYNFEYNSYAYDPAQDIYFSGGDVTVTYEGNIYSVYVNGVLYSGSSSLEQNSPTLSNYNCKTFTLKSNYSYDDIPAEETVGGSTEYRIVYRDITDGSIQKTYTFTIFNKLPEIILRDNDNEPTITSTLEESSTQLNSSIVNIRWGSISDCSFDGLNDSIDNTVTVASLYSRDKNGAYTNNVSITQGQSISEEGFYKIRISNSKLGNFREVYFAISFKESPLYTVSVNGKAISPSSAENFSLITSRDKDSTMLIDVIYSKLSQLLSQAGEKSDPKYLDDLASLKNQLGYSDDRFVSSSVGICSLVDIPHYYSIETPTVTYHSNIKLKSVEFVFVNNTYERSFIKGYGDNPEIPKNVETDYWTTIYLVYNLEGPIRIEFFAVTKVPLTNTLLRNDLTFTNEDSTNNAQQTISLNQYRSNYQIYYPQIKNGSVQLSWNKLATPITSPVSDWYRQGNVVRIFDEYGVSTEPYELEFEVASHNANYLTSTVVGSGSHRIRFQDIAGNVQKFNSVGSYQQIEYYTLDLIDSIIYYLTYNEQDYNPIQYGVFNDELVLNIDQQYTHHYLNGRANISVTRNGSYYNDFENIDNKSYKFTRSGRYVVTLSGSYARTANAMRTVNYSFTIIDSNSARLAYEFVGVSGYEILEVTRNGQDITDNFRDEDGKVLSIFITSSSALSGNGNYSITLKYGKRQSEVLTYSFTINDYIPTISCNIEHGGSTTGSIEISFNPSLIYEQLGECYVRILTYNEDSKTFYLYGRSAIDESSLNDGSIKTIEITRSNSYYIQVETKNGNIISSFRVNRNEPLNTFAIIIIVVAVIVVIALIIIIVKLRTKMKVK